MTDLTPSEVLFEAAKDEWEKTLQCPFLQQLARGTLPRELFSRYMVHDLLYLERYIKAAGRVLAKARDISQKTCLARMLEDTLAETRSVHIPLMERLGISKEEVRKTHLYPVAEEYADYLYEKASEGFLEGFTCLLCCSWVYAYLAQRLAEEFPGAKRHPLYGQWIKNYTGKEYRKANDELKDNFDQAAKDASPEKMEKLRGIFLACGRYENGFWDELGR